MAGEIIRLGDATSHGGKVIEGSLADICHGKPIAYVGHKTHCPKCKGDFPIVEGVLTTSFYGKGVALAGMQTACGATLVASQFLDTVEVGGGSAPAPADKQAGGASKAGQPTGTQAATSVNASSLANSVAPPHTHAYDLVFKVLGDNGAIAPNTSYKIILDDGQTFVGVTDAEGITERICSDHPQTAKIEVPYYDHSSSDTDHQYGACSC